MLPAKTGVLLEHSSFYVGSLLPLLAALISSGDTKDFKDWKYGQSHFNVWGTHLDTPNHYEKIPVVHEKPEVPEILRRMQRQAPLDSDPKILQQVWKQVPLDSDDPEILRGTQRQALLDSDDSKILLRMQRQTPIDSDNPEILLRVRRQGNDSVPISDDEDEIGSGDSTFTNSTLNSVTPGFGWVNCDGRGKFRCPFETKCAYLCNGVEECYGGTDEMEETCPSETTVTAIPWMRCVAGPEYILSCSYEDARCPYLCDDEIDCSDGSDESIDACLFNNRVCPRGNLTLFNSTVEMNNTSPGEMVNFSCPGFRNRTGIWNCEYNGEWSKKPDLIPCGESAKFFLPPADTNSSSVVDNITMAIARTMRQQQLMPVDILNILSGLEELQKQYELDIWDDGADAFSLSERYLKGVLNVTSVLLKQYDSWKYMPDDQIRSSSSRLQKVIVDAALTKASIVDSSTVLDYSSEQIGIRMATLTGDEFDRSENRFYEHKTFRDTNILLPRQFYDSVQEGMERITVVFNSFDNLQCLTNDIPCVTEDLPDEDLAVDSKAQVNSGVIGATVGFGTGWRATGDEYVEIKFTHIYNGVNLTMSNVKCVWWDTKSHRWLRYGCKLVDSNRFHTTCQCNHLTNLAVIMDLKGVLNRGSILWKILEWITIIGCSLSILFLAIGIVGFLLLKIARERKKSSVGAKKYQIRLHLCACLLLAELVLLAGLNATSNTSACSFVAALLHFFFLATFAWSAIEAINLYLAMMKVFDSQISQKHFIIIGYGIPLSLVGLTLAISQAKGYGSKDVCWLAPNGIIWSFAGTLAVIMLINVIAFVMVMRVVWKERSVGNTSGGSSKPKIHKVIGSIAIFLVLGLTWITGFFYFSQGSKPLAVVFTLLNSIQGVCIVLFGIFLEADVRKELIQIISTKFQMKRVPADENTSPGNAPSGNGGSQLSTATTSKNPTGSTDC